MTVSQLFKRSDLYAILFILIPLASVSLICWLYSKRLIVFGLPLVFFIVSIIAVMTVLWYKGTRLFKDFLADTPYSGIVYSIYSHVNLKAVPGYLKTNEIIENLNSPGYSTEKFLADNKLTPEVHKKYSTKLNLVYGLLLLVSIWVPALVAEYYQLDYWLYYGSAGFIISMMLMRVHEKNYNKRKSAVNEPELKIAKEGVLYKDELIGWDEVDSWSAPAAFESKHPGRVFIYYTISSHRSDGNASAESIELNMGKMQVSKYDVLALLAHYKHKYSK